MAYQLNGELYPSTNDLVNLATSIHHLYLNKCEIPDAIQWDVFDAWGGPAAACIEAVKHSEGVFHVWMCGGFVVYTIAQFGKEEKAAA